MTWVQCAVGAHSNRTVGGTAFEGNSGGCDRRSLRAYESGVGKILRYFGSPKLLEKNGEDIILLATHGRPLHFSEQRIAVAQRVSCVGDPNAREAIIIKETYEIEQRG